jgi:hypothetical protein
MKQSVAGQPDRGTAFYTSAESSFGSHEIWKADFSARCAALAGPSAMRTLPMADCRIRVTLHETGNIAGFNPILVMDVWEHAFILDYKPADGLNILKHSFPILIGRFARSVYRVVRALQLVKPLMKFLAENSFREDLQFNVTNRLYPTVWIALLWARF